MTRVRFSKSDVKAALRELRNWILLRAAVRALRYPLPARGVRTALAMLRKGWGNEHFSGHLEYLVEMYERALHGRGSILECGSGCSTLVLGLAAERAGTQATTLEHSEEWLKRIEPVMREFGIRTVSLRLSPLRSYGDYDWYDIDGLPDTGQLGLVVCDGPPGGTKGGRHGLLPSVASRLERGSVILLDDAARDGERELISRWSQAAALDVQMRSSSKGAFAILTLGAPRAIS